MALNGKISTNNSNGEINDHDGVNVDSDIDFDTIRRDNVILHLEHINFDVPPDEICDLFFLSDGLGFTRDPHATPMKSDTKWFNWGQQQLHLPLSNQSNCLQGRIGLSTSMSHYAKIQQNINKLKTLKEFKDIPIDVKRICIGTNQAHSRNKHISSVYGGKLLSLPMTTNTTPLDSTIEYLEVHCPYGNIYEIYPLCLSSFDAVSKVDVMIDNNYNTGLIYLFILSPLNARDEIMKYYSTYFNAPVNLTDEGDVIVNINLNQRLYFSPTSTPISPPTWHYAIYIEQFNQTFTKLSKDGLIQVFNDRSDNVTTLSQAITAKQFRAYHIAEGLAIEQEIRNQQHKHYNRKLINDTPEIKNLNNIKI